MSFEGNLDKILQRQAELSEKLSSGIRGDDFVQASRDYSELEPIVEKISDWLFTSFLYHIKKTLLSFL